MIRILFLDDNPNRHAAMRSERFNDARVDHAFDAAHAIEFLNANTYDLIMLDHDLSEDIDKIASTPDGSYVAGYMARHLIQHSDTTVIVHSLNPDGAKNMMGILNDAGYSDVHVVPFAWNKLRVEGSVIKVEL